MAKGQNKNKPFQKRRINGSTSTIDNEYDLEKNIKRINSYSRTRRNSKDKFHSNITDSGERDGISSYGNGVIETPHTSSSRNELEIMLHGILIHVWMTKLRILTIKTIRRIRI